MCSCKHFCFRQKYCPRPQGSADDRYPVLPSAASAVRDIMTYKCPQLNATRMVAFASSADTEYMLADTFTDESACVCGCVCFVHVYRCIRKHMHVCTAMCIRERVGVVHGSILVHTSLLCYCAYSRFVSRRMAEGSWLSHQCMEA